MLENDLVFGSVNANRRHYEAAAQALAEADNAWLERLITRRVPLDRWREALEREEHDIKVVVELGAAHSAQAPITSCHHATSASSVGLDQAPANLRLDLAGRAHHQDRAGDREAAVGEDHERARDVAARAQVLDDGVAGDLARVRRIAVGVGPGARGVDRDAAGVGARRAQRPVDGPGAPALEQLRQLARDLAADEHEQPVARLQPGRAAREQRLVAAHDQRHERVARQSEVAQARARRRVAGTDHVLDHVGAQLAHGADLEDRGGAGRLVRRDPEPARDGVDRRALEHGREQDGEEDDVEERLGLRDVLDHGEESRARPGPRRAARPSRGTSSRAR